MIVPYVATALLVFATLYSAMVCFRQAADKGTGIFPQAASQSARVVIGTLTLALLMALASWLTMSSHNSTQRSLRFLIPEGYTGWVRVEFEAQGAPPLPMEGGHYVLKIPPDGVFRTSSAEQYGWAKDHYYYYSAQGERVIPASGPDELIWGRINGEESGARGKRKYEEFFVGTAEQFNNQMRE